MADLTNIQAADPVEVVDKATGTRLLPNSDGSINANALATGMSGYVPDPSSVPAASAALTQDAGGSLETRGTVTSDEGAFRDDFSGSALATALTGTLAFVASSLAVVGTGTLFTAQIQAGDYIKKTTDAETLYVRVESVQDDTHLTLETAYAGTTATVAGVSSNWVTATPTGGSVAVASSLVSLASGTVSGNVVSLVREGDYLPLTIQYYGNLSQRIANQTALFGFVSPSTGAQMSVQMSGTVATALSFVTGNSSAAADTQTTPVTLPAGGLTSGNHLYKLDLSSNQATLSIDGTVVAINSLHLPAPYDALNIITKITNTGLAASSTTLALDYIYLANWDRIQVDNDFTGEASRVQITDSTGVNVAGVTASGSIQVSPVLSNKTIYSAVFNAIAPAGTLNDLIVITGSATKTIRVLRMEISPIQTTTGTNKFFVLMRSTADTGGTSTSPTMVALDQSSPAATATVKAYTAGPTSGTLIGNVRATNVLTGPAGTQGLLPTLMDFTNCGLSNGVVLRGAAQMMALNLGGIATPGAFNVTGWVEWVEE